MHIEKNILDNILGTLLELDGRNKDTFKSRFDLEKIGIRKSLHMKLDTDGKKYTCAHARYCLKRDGKKQLCQYLSHCTYPDGFCASMSKCVKLQTQKISGLKTHDCHILLQRALPAGLRGLVGPDIYEAIADLGKIFKSL